MEKKLTLRNNSRDSDWKVLQYINSYSPSLCLAKWYNATIWLGSGMTTSCHHPLPHQVSIDDIKLNPKALHNTLKKKQEREQMQKGERPSGCEYCWKIEDINRDNISDRVYKTVIYSDEDLHTAFNTPASEDVDLQTLEIAFDRTCQFACSYCNPAFSSTWVKDITTSGPYTQLISDGRNHYTHTHPSGQLFKYDEQNPYIDAFFKWWDTDLHKTLKELRITGGEPLMSGYTWKLLDWFKANRGQSNTRLAINSNLGFDSTRLQEFINKISGIDHVELYTSNEAVGIQAEYIRDGLDYVQWLENMRTLAMSGAVKQLHCMCTINALCLDSLPEFLDQLVELKKQFGRDFPNFTLNILRFPSFQSPLVLPDNLKQRYSENLVNWLARHSQHKYLHEHEINHVRRLIDYLNVVKTPHSDAFDQGALRHDFKQFYQQYDIRRNKNLAATFPSLLQLYAN
jgi:organic radical activating enzyme